MSREVESIIFLSLHFYAIGLVQWPFEMAIAKNQLLLKILEFRIKKKIF